MGDLIDRDAAIEAVRIFYADECALVDSIEEQLEKLPSAQPLRIKGKWVRKESDLSWWYECSECGESPLFDPYENEVLTRFCPWCGAEMRQQEEQGNVTLN